MEAWFTHLVLEGFFVYLELTSWLAWPPVYLANTVIAGIYGLTWLSMWVLGICTDLHACMASTCLA